MSELIAYENQINNIFQLIGNTEDGYYKFKKVKQITAENGLCLTHSSPPIPFPNQAIFHTQDSKKISATISLMIALLLLMSG